MQNFLLKMNLAFRFVSKTQNNIAFYYYLYISSCVSYSFKIYSSKKNDSIPLPLPSHV